MGIEHIQYMKTAFFTLSVGQRVKKNSKKEDFHYILSSFSAGVLLLDTAENLTIWHLDWAF